MIKELILTISIVIYKSNEELLIETLKTLVLSCEKAKLSSYRIYLINHEKTISENINKFISENIELIQGHGNIGYGSGHNIIKNRLGNFKPFKIKLTFIGFDSRVSVLCPLWFLKKFFKVVDSLDIAGLESFTTVHI